MVRQLYIGLMSGTSMDGIDGVLADLAPGARFQVLDHAHTGLQPDLQQELLSLNQSGADELHRSMLAANALARAYADVTMSLLDRQRLSPQQIIAIGAHGQTVRHRPGEFDATGYTCQLLNGALLSECTGIDVVCDFRSRDVAAGGQGAPLVPAFHHAALGLPGQDAAVLNLGGIANLSLLAADGAVSGHDCGPGNVLLDTWCARHTGHPYDQNGAWSASGQVHRGLLHAMLQDEYIRRPPPKSTGRDWFNADWLQTVLARQAPATATLLPQDVQATLAECTASAAANDLREHLPGARRLAVCGGGAFNGDLMRRLQHALPGVHVASVAQFSQMQPLQVEALAFAWLAQAMREGVAGNRPSVTGARGLRVLGALHLGNQH